MIRAKVNDKFCDTAVRDYITLSKADGYEPLRCPGAIPEVVTDPDDSLLVHALSGAKRAEVWDYLLEHFPNHPRVLEFEGFECWQYDCKLLRDVSTCKFIVDGGNNLNQMAVGAQIPDYLEAAQDITCFFLFPVSVEPRRGAR